MKRKIASGLPSSETFVRASQHVCLCQQGSGAAGGLRDGEVSSQRFLFAATKVASTLPSSLLRAADTCQTAAGMLVRETRGKKEKKKEKKNEDMLHSWCQDPFHPPPSSLLFPSWGARARGSPGVCLKASLTAGQPWRRYFDVFVS